MAERQSSKKESRTKVTQESPRTPDQETQFTPDIGAPTITHGGIDTRFMKPAPALHLQRTIGNAAVQRLLAGTTAVSQPPAASFVGSFLRRKPQKVAAQKASGGSAKVFRKVRSELLQRALWTNSAAKFLTDNGNPDIPNSEYKVNGSGYMRYAPINMTRALEQVFHEGGRSFVYIEAADDIETNAKYDAVWEKPINVTAVSGDDVTFKTGKKGFERSPEVVGHITPTEGARVFDFGVDDSTKQLAPDSHVGHAVEELGETLPTLDDPDALKAARDYQHYLIEQYLMLKEKGLVTDFKDWNEKSSGQKPV